MADNAGATTGMASVDTSKELGRLATPIIPHILNMYNCKSTALDYEIYAPNATFEDPLMRAHGVAQIKSAFYSIPKVFKEGRILDYRVEEDEQSPNSGEIRIHNTQEYKFIQKVFSVKTLIKLQVEEGKIVRHEDMWNEKPLWNKNTVKFPLVGRMAQTLRRGNMMATHCFMGFGKDPQPN